MTTIVSSTNELNIPLPKACECCQENYLVWVWSNQALLMEI